MKVLLLTVGGSDTPIIKAIGYHKPDYVVFFCTEDKGKESKGSRKGIDGEGLVYQGRACEQCGYKSDDRPNIISRTQLKDDDYEIVTVEPDNPYDCYEKADLLIKRFA